MSIDFHTHIFPDKIAESTVSMLMEMGGIPSFSNGTEAGLLQKMEDSGVDLSITLPVLTSPKQFGSVNRFAAEINEKYKNKKRRLISFAGIHPRCENIPEKMRYIKNAGFLGVKIHPDYQSAYITDEGYIEIVRCAKEHGLIVVTHSGADIGFRGQPVRCTPALAKEFINKVKYEKIVFAHLGASEMQTDVYNILAGEDVYFDTAYVLRFTEAEFFKKLIAKHGSEKILFATDSPWSDISGDIELLRSFSVGKETEEKIFSQNAKELLGI